jgi:serine/threonine protein kinase
MKEGTMSESDFVQEAKVMTKLRHPNLVMLFGLCIEHRPICIVTEFMKHGSLLSFLRNKVNSLKTNVTQLINMCTQVCEGMAYLEANNYIHRDLAARNCLVGEGHVVKVADFGLARLVADSNEYTSSSGTKFPIKWAPPEVLWFTKFSSKSDIWAFGVLMWEVMTCGQMPYGRCSNAQVVEMIRNGERLQRPRLCTTESFAVMESCWSESPDKRPTFAQLNHRLRMLLK